MFFSALKLKKFFYFTVTLHTYNSVKSLNVDLYGFCDVTSLSGKKSDLKFETLKILVQIPNG